MLSQAAKNDSGTRLVLWRSQGRTAILAGLHTSQDSSMTFGRSSHSLIMLAATLIGCATGNPAQQSTSASTMNTRANEATLAQIYFWRAKPGKLEEYTRYIRERAEPIDAEAQRSGAFVSVTTYMASDTTV